MSDTHAIRAILAIAFALVAGALAGPVAAFWGLAAMLLVWAVLGRLR